ncbi:MAG: hypothetical protein H0W65_08735 [Sphingomonas sp.]|uniref:hypothetical protein n=1 Tax=Sphingomonas sp. TaxID=28214 RepID=UPI0017AF1237|nr:hypothetical protein [Sphingomonas sp.]MBA3667793.1 hypothetical protein [Sphingomonas sp.]
MRDRDLVRLYWPVELRPAFDALFAIDDALGDVVATSTEPALGAIRLAWWREALQRLDTAPPPPEPKLYAAVQELLSRGISGEVLAGLEDGWATLLDEEADTDRIAERGARLFAIAAQLLGATDERLADAGRLFSFAQVARRGLAPFPKELAFDRLRGHRFARAARPLTALARLAARDRKRAPGMEPEATPARAAALLAHRLFGIVA